MSDTFELTGEAPISSGNEWRDIAIFQDGSGLAGRKYDEATAILDAEEEVVKLKRLFIAAHCGTLAGAWWRLGHHGAEIRLEHCRYRGRKTTPKDIAQLWPDAEWSREKRKYTAEPEWDWVATVDGVVLRIEQAETEEPAPKLQAGRLNLAAMA